MKKHSTALFLSLLAGGPLLAQHPSFQPAGKHRSYHRLPAEVVSSAERADPIWTDDFSVPGNWTMGNFVGATNDWVIGTTPPGGDPNFAIDPIESTTAANGFALYDSNLFCDDDSAYLQIVDPIDLSAYPGVTLQFEQFYRNYSGSTSVQVSNDGTNWTTYFVNAELPANTSTANPSTIILPITDVAGGEATVWIRFVYGGACDFAWMVDDVALLVQDNNDLTVDVVKTTMWDYVNTTTYDSVPYTVFPVSEIRPLGLNMTVSNNGYFPAINTTATITSSDGYDESENLGDLASAASAQFVAPAYTPSSTIGVKTLNYSVASDSTELDMADNAQSLTVEVSNYSFGRDEGVLEGFYNDSDDGDPYKLGSVFHVRSNETLYGIDVVFPTSSATGLELTAQLMETDDDFTPIAETSDRTLNPEDLSAAGEANWVTFIFDEPVALTAGSDYMIGVRHYGGADVRVGTSGNSPEQTSFIYQELTDTWFFVTATPMVRMNFNPSVGISESDVHNGVGLGQNYPNPATGTSRIDFSLQAGAQATLELRDVSGKLVRILAQGNMAPGIHRVDVNTADLEAGVYFYTLTTGSTMTSKRMTVVR